MELSGYFQLVNVVGIFPIDTIAIFFTFCGQKYDFKR
jgi:hypothetical protein